MSIRVAIRISRPVFSQYFISICLLKIDVSNSFDNNAHRMIWLEHSPPSCSSFCLYLSLPESTSCPLTFSAQMCIPERLSHNTLQPLASLPPNLPYNPVPLSSSSYFHIAFTLLRSPMSTMVNCKLHCGISQCLMILPQASEPHCLIFTKIQASLWRNFLSCRWWTAPITFCR